MCARSHKYNIISEYPFRTLYDEVRERRINKEWFNEGEILSILYSCTAGLNHLYSLGFIH
jgi:hypothetical protein